MPRRTPLRRAITAVAALIFAVTAALLASAPPASAAVGDRLVDCQYPVVGAGQWKDGGGVEIDPADPGFAYISLAPWSTDGSHTTIGRQIAMLKLSDMATGYADGSKSCTLDNPSLYTSDQPFAFGALAIDPYDSSLFGAERTTESSPAGAEVSANVLELTSAGGTSITTTLVRDYNQNYATRADGGAAGTWSLDGGGATSLLLPALAVDPQDGSFWIARESWSFDPQGPHNVCNSGGGICTDIYNFQPIAPFNPYSSASSFGVPGNVGGLATDPIDKTIWVTKRAASGASRQACQYGLDYLGHANGVLMGSCVPLSGVPLVGSAQPGDATIDNCTFFPRKALWTMVTTVSGWPYLQAYDVGSVASRPAHCDAPAPTPTPTPTPTPSGGSSNSTGSLPATPDAVRVVAPAFDPVYRPSWVPVTTPLYFPGQSLAFDVTSLLDPTGRTLVYTWDFDGPNGPLMPQVLPGQTTHSYPIPGFYDLVVTVTDAKTGKVVATIRKPMNINFGFTSYTTVGDSRTVPLIAMSGSTTIVFKLGELSKGTGGNAVKSVTWVINGKKYGPSPAAKVVRAPAKRKLVRPKRKAGQKKAPKPVMQKARSSVKWSVTHADGTTITRQSGMFG